MIAVCLQTCDRPDYTARTVESFLAMNDRERFLLLHADDASADGRNAQIVSRAGFRTVVRMTHRKGIRAVRRKLIAKARQHGAAWVLMLENDIESIRPFPWPLFEFIQHVPTIYCLRLFGEFKDAAGTDRCLTTHKWKDDAPVTWSPLAGAPEPAEVADIHWTPQPSVTRAEDAHAIHSIKVQPPLLTARVVANVMGHFGTLRTPGTIQ